MSVNDRRPRRVPRTLWIGLFIIFTCEILLFIDVVRSGRGPVRSDAEILKIPAPVDWLGWIARLIAPNMTPFAWFGYIIFLDGLLILQGRASLSPPPVIRGRVRVGAILQSQIENQKSQIQTPPPQPSPGVPGEGENSGSPLRKRPHHFAILCLGSIFIWCVFDWFNFYSIHAWDYIGMPPDPYGRLIGYFIAFASIVPGMLMSGQMLINFRLFDWARVKPWPRMPGLVLWISFGAGLLMLVWPMIHHDPIANLTLWTSLVFLLDPINYLLGRPSMWRDWQNGWYGRTLACFAGGLLCGFLWEFWNYWALSKWVYHLPFLGSLEQYRYFEMPLMGLIGFLPFGIECWVMWQLIRIPLDGLVEELPDDRTLM